MSRDRRRPRRRHAHRLHGRPRLRAVDAQRTGARRVGPRSSRSGRRYGIHAAGIRALDVCRVEAGPDPDRGRVHERAPRGRARAAVLAVRARPRPPGGLQQGRRLQRAARAARRAAGGRPGAAAGRPGARLGRHRGDVRQARPRARRSARSPTATPCPSTRTAGRWGAPPASPGAPRSRRWWASARWTSRTSSSGRALGGMEGRGRARQGGRHRRPAPRSSTPSASAP